MLVVLNRFVDFSLAIFSCQLKLVTCEARQWLFGLQALNLTRVLCLSRYIIECVYDLQGWLHENFDQVGLRD